MARSPRQTGGYGAVHTLLDPGQSIESLSEQLAEGGMTKFKSVSWELPRKSE
jgi:hypothetical protein